jgi:hypothetical protein
MHVVACNAPLGTIDPAPLTSLPIHMDMDGSRMTAFWTSDDQYLVCVEGMAGTTWYRIEADAAAPASDEATRIAIGAMMADILPLGAGRIAFPVGSSGRRVYRVWRAARGAAKGKGGTMNTANNGRTRILGVLAARSRRQPA